MCRHVGRRLELAGFPEFQIVSYTHAQTNHTTYLTLTVTHANTHPTLRLGGAGVNRPSVMSAVDRSGETEAETFMDVWGNDNLSDVCLKVKSMPSTYASQVIRHRNDLT